MTRKNVFALLTSFFLAIVLFSNVHAANYSFSQNSMAVNVTIDAKGNFSIDYSINFSNDKGASPIDFIDIGLPNSSYDLSSITASVDGKPITDIQKSSYVEYGVALGLAGNAIQPGAKGSVVVHVSTQGSMIYPYAQSDKQNYASFQFVPNYFSSSYVHGPSDITVTLHLPPGIQPSEPIYYTPSSAWPGPAQPEIGMDQNGQITYIWHAANANSSTKYSFGGAFPAQYIPASAIVQPPSTWDYILILLNSVFCCILPIVIAILIPIGIIVLAVVRMNKRKLDYLPPKISIEGQGVKRGLTAVEAAVLMEQPLDKVFTMILFGLLKKNAATVIAQNPFELEAANPPPDGLNNYELDFLKAFATKTADPAKLQDMMVALVNSMTEKMKGFSRKDTVAYYQDIINRAWAQVEAAGTPEVKSEAFNNNMEWTMMDHNFNERTQTAFNTMPVFLPVWWGRYDPVFRSTHSGAAISTPSIGTSSLPMPAVHMPAVPGADFAAHMINGVSNFSSSVVGNVSTFTSRITNLTNPVPIVTSSGGGFHGGGGHCACACAGCACACAGGGR